MAIKTQTVWAVPENQFLSSKIFVLYNKISQMKREGKVATDSKIVVQSFPKFITEREWVDETAAQEWISFVLEQGAESAVIVSST